MGTPVSALPLLPATGESRMLSRSSLFRGVTSANAQHCLGITGQIIRQVGTSLTIQIEGNVRHIMADDQSRVALDRTPSDVKFYLFKGNRWTILLLILLLSEPVFGSGLSRDIGCGDQNPGRAQEICKSISDALEWDWFGHAIIAPGWRVTYRTARTVYCKKNIVPGDLPLLQTLKKPVDGDWRLSTAAGYLIRILNGRLGSSDEPEWSVFNAKNPHYVLREGCSGL
jgi:hypothetical protein